MQQVAAVDDFAEVRFQFGTAARELRSRRERDRQFAHDRARRIAIVFQQRCVERLARYEVPNIQQIDDGGIEGSDLIVAAPPLSITRESQSPRAASSRQKRLRANAAWLQASTLPLTAFHIQETHWLILAKIISLLARAAFPCLRKAKRGAQN